MNPKIQTDFSELSKIFDEAKTTTVIIVPSLQVLASIELMNQIGTKGTTMSNRLQIKRMTKEGKAYETTLQILDTAVDILRAEKTKGYLERYHRLLYSAYGSMCRLGHEIDENVPKFGAKKRSYAQLDGDIIEMYEFPKIRKILRPYRLTELQSLNALLIRERDRREERLNLVARIFNGLVTNAGCSSRILKTNDL
jgi:hypothetical protein